MSIPTITKYRLKAETLGKLTQFLQNLTYLTLDLCSSVKLDKCTLLTTLNIRASAPSPGMQIPDLQKLTRLLKLSVWGAPIDEKLIAAFAHLKSLETLQIERCAMLCSWTELGVALAHTSLKSLIIRGKYELKDIEALLQFLQLDHLFLSLFSWSNRVIFRLFADVFNETRTNPRSFLIEHDNYAQNLNGCIQSLATSRDDLPAI